MTTQTDDSTDLFASLDDCPACVECDNEARYWLKSHTCMGALVCEKHKQKAVDYLNNGFALHRRLRCNECLRTFDRITDYLTVIPL
jgi:hypothetical protein